MSRPLGLSFATLRLESGLEDQELAWCLFFVVLLGARALQKLFGFAKYTKLSCPSCTRQVLADVGTTRDCMSNGRACLGRLWSCVNRPLNPESGRDPNRFPDSSEWSGTSVPRELIWGCRQGVKRQRAFRGILQPRQRRQHTRRPHHDCC